MTHKQRMLMAVRGEMPDRLPWTIRVDLWYNSNTLREPFPLVIHKVSPLEVANVLPVMGVCYYPIRGNYKYSGKLRFPSFKFPMPIPL